MTNLKPISRESISAALDKAERYRLLNEPFFAESICLDVLAITPGDQRALVVYLLSLCDQLSAGKTEVIPRARETIGKLHSEYERLYYSGMLAERRAVEQLHQGKHGANDAAYFELREAMGLYEKAEAKKPDPTHDDAILRYNTCVRLIEMHDLHGPAQQHGDYPFD